VLSLSATSSVLTTKHKRKQPLLPKKQRKEAKAERKVDKRAAGRDNAYVIEQISIEQRETIWELVKKKKTKVSRRDNPLPMKSCWVYGEREAYSYYPLGHGNSQLKLTQLAMWHKTKKVGESPFFS
jgi:hypothetical protein